MTFVAHCTRREMTAAYHCTGQDSAVEQARCRCSGDGQFCCIEGEEFPLRRRSLEQGQRKLSVQ